MHSDEREKLLSELLTYADLEGAKSAKRIKVIGVGGGGGNAVNRLIEDGVEGIEFLVANTDRRSLTESRASVKLEIGKEIAHGLGSGGNPEIGRRAAMEDTDKIVDALEGADMIFVTAGLGGGTGTGAAPIIGSLATELGALTVAVVTKPFLFEGRRRSLQAEQGLEELRGCVDSVIVIPNDRLLKSVTKAIPFLDAFGLADGVLRQAVRGISDIVTRPGLINVDFADVSTIMQGKGIALMGTGTAAGENRAIEAVCRAINSPLLEDSPIQGAKALLVNVTGALDMSLFEISEAMNLIHDLADPEAHIVFGAVIDERLTGTIEITVIATHLASDAAFPSEYRNKGLPLWAAAAAVASESDFETASSALDYETASTATIATPIRDLTNEGDAIIAEMQTDESKRAMKSAFRATPRELGNAAAFAGKHRVRKDEREQDINSPGVHEKTG